MTEATRTLADAVWDVLRTIEDPELPISIVDLGLVREVRVEAGMAAVRLVPTWIACPALAVIRAALARLKLSSMMSSSMRLSLTGGQVGWTR